jgi:hypothetical protein
MLVPRSWMSRSYTASPPHLRRCVIWMLLHFAEQYLCWLQRIWQNINANERFKTKKTVFIHLPNLSKLCILFKLTFLVLCCLHGYDTYSETECGKKTKGEVKLDSSCYIDFLEVIKWCSNKTVAQSIKETETFHNVAVGTTIVWALHVINI